MIAPASKLRWHAGAMLLYIGLSLFILDHGAGLTTHIPVIAGGQTPAYMLAAVSQLNWQVTHRGDTSIFAAPAPAAK